MIYDIRPDIFPTITKSASRHEARASCRERSECRPIADNGGHQRVLSGRSLSLGGVRGRITTFYSMLLIERSAARRKGLNLRSIMPSRRRKWKERYRPLLHEIGFPKISFIVLAGAEKFLECRTSRSPENRLNDSQLGNSILRTIPWTMILDEVKSPVGYGYGPSVIVYLFFPANLTTWRCDVSEAQKYLFPTARVAYSLLQIQARTYAYERKYRQASVSHENSFVRDY